MRGPDHLWTVLVCAFISASCLPRFQCGRFCNRHPRYHRPLFSASVELFDPEPVSVPDAKLGLFPFATAPFVAPSDWEQSMRPAHLDSPSTFLLLPRLHHSLPQFLQWILRPPPHDAVVPQR